MALLQTLQDTFTGTTLDTTTRWDTSQSFAPFSITQNNTLTLSATGAGDALLVSRSTYDLTGSYLTVQVVSAPGAGTGGNNIADINVYDPASGNFDYNWTITNTTLQANWLVSPSSAIIFSTTYNSSTHAFLRIRESGGTIFWDYSSDSLAWTNAGSHIKGATITSAGVYVEAFPTGSSTSTFIVDNINIVTSQTIQTQTGKSRISLITSRTQAGIARITVKVTKTQIGKARITNTTSNTQSGTGRIGSITQQLQAGRANIRTTTARTQVARGSIAVKTTRIQLGRANLGFTTTKIQLGKSNIGAKTARAQLGVARIIFGTDNRTIPSVFIHDEKPSVTRSSQPAPTMGGVVKNM